MTLPHYAAAKKAEEVLANPENTSRATTEKEDLARRHRVLTLQLERADLDGKVRETRNAGVCGIWVRRKHVFCKFRAKLNVFYGF